jgi:hypothetical protein
MKIYLLMLLVTAIVIVANVSDWRKWGRAEPRLIGDQQ